MSISMEVNFMWYVSQLQIDMSRGDSQGIVVDCGNCGYEWEYSGTMWVTTCPRCNRKTETGLRPDED